MFIACYLCYLTKQMVLPMIIWRQKPGIKISKDCVRKLSNVSTRKMWKSLPVTNIPTKLESYNKFPTTWIEIYKNDIPHKQINSNSSIHLWWQFGKVYTVYLEKKISKCGLSYKNEPAKNTSPQTQHNTDIQHGNNHINMWSSWV